MRSAIRKPLEYVLAIFILPCLFFTVTFGLARLFPPAPLTARVVHTSVNAVRPAASPLLNATGLQLPLLLVHCRIRISGGGVRPLDATTSHLSLALRDGTQFDVVEKPASLLAVMYDSDPGFLPMAHPIQYESSARDNVLEDRYFVLPIAPETWQTRVYAFVSVKPPEIAEVNSFIPNTEE